MPWLLAGNVTPKFSGSSLQGLTNENYRYNKTALEIQFGTAARHQVFERLQSNPAGHARAHWMTCARQRDSRAHMLQQPAPRRAGPRPD